MSQQKKKKTIQPSKAKPARKTESQKMPGRTAWFFLAGILLLTFLIFLPILKGQFLNYDDDYYITENPLLQAFTGANLNALFTQTYGNQYSPVAMTIMALEIQLLGLNPGALKFVSILFHLANILLVFLLVRKLFSRADYAIITAGLFAVHTLQVESVAWLAASMKVTSYALFSLASMLVYLQYLEKKKGGYLWLSLGFFALSALCKEQAVVLPVLLLAIDYLKGRKLLDKTVILEKVPFFIAALIFGLTTLSLADDMRGAGQILPYTLTQRILFASYALTSYLSHHLLPIDLSTFYAYPPKGHIPAWYYLTPLVSVGILVALFVSWIKEKRILVFGILFFLVNIFLVILSQITSVRDVLMADRYVYLSSIGFFLILAYALQGWAGENKSRRNLAFGLIGLYLAVLSALSYQRTGVWENSITVFTDAIEKGQSGIPGVYSPSLAVPYNNRGWARRRAGDNEGAISDYNLAIQCNPGYGKPYSNRGTVYFNTGNDKAALDDFNKSLELDPGSAETYSNRGAVYAKLGNFEQAKQDLQKALQIKPQMVDALSNLALIWYNEGKDEKALSELDKILEVKPNAPDFLNFKGVILQRMKRYPEAEQFLTKAIEFSPNTATFYMSRSRLFFETQNRERALQDAIQAQSLGAQVDPGYLNALR